MHCEPSSHGGVPQGTYIAAMVVSHKQQVQQIAQSLPSADRKQQCKVSTLPTVLQCFDSAYGCYQLQDISRKCPLVSAHYHGSIFRRRGGDLAELHFLSNMLDPRRTEKGLYSVILLNASKETNRMTLFHSTNFLVNYRMRLMVFTRVDP